MNENKKFFTLRNILSILFVVVLLGLSVGRFYNYVSNYYPASEEAWEYRNNPAEGITVVENDNTIVFCPKNPTAGFIFYPGGLVETEAYAPLMEQLAEEGIETILVKMPFYMAIFDANGARHLQDKHPEISDWYIGGHSLGGAMSAMYAGRHVSEYEGLVLLGAYSATDLSKSDLDVLLISGSEDKVMNRENYAKNLSKLPAGYTEIVIKGGCHSYFGDYGIQDGDGDPTITVQQQTTETVKDIIDFINAK